MKILYVITSLTQGGAQRIVCDLADAMFEKGHEVKIAYLTGQVITQPTNKEIELVNIKLINGLSLPKSYLALARTVKKYEPDVVHSHMVHANTLSRLVRITTPIKKLISTAHNSNEGGLLRMIGYRVTHSLSDTTTNVSNTAVKSYEKKLAVPKGSMKTVYNGINFERFTYQYDAKQSILDELELQSNTRLILAVGRLHAQKNYPSLLRAIKTLQRKVDFPFFLLIAGEGELHNDLERLIVDLELTDKVKLLGSRNDIPTLMSAADLFVLSSDYEGLPTVLIEALACECQVVSTDVSGVREIVDDYATIVPPQNSDLLAQAVLEKLSKIERNLSGRQYVLNKFGIEKSLEKWLKLYNGD